MDFTTLTVAIFKLFGFPENSSFLAPQSGLASQTPDSASSHHRHTCSTFEMEAIKKKMQAMKVEKDNACDRVDVCEEQCKAARVGGKAEL